MNWLISIPLGLLIGALVAVAGFQIRLNARSFAIALSVLALSLLSFGTALVGAFSTVLLQLASIPRGKEPDTSHVLPIVMGAALGWIALTCTWVACAQSRALKASFWITWLTGGIDSCGLPLMTLLSFFIVAKLPGRIEAVEGQMLATLLAWAVSAALVPRLRPGEFPPRAPAAEDHGGSR